MRTASCSFSVLQNQLVRSQPLSVFFAELAMFGDAAVWPAIRRSKLCCENGCPASKAIGSRARQCLRLPEQMQNALRET
jgi:hypothetical protein